MSQSLARLHTHIIFSTKHREHFINDDIAAPLFGYIGATCHSLECQPIEIGGWYDHVHILCAQSKKIAMMKLVQEIKVQSSQWFKQQYGGDPHFYWQLGYAAVSVNPSDSASLQHYIRNQKAHHAAQSYQDECRIYLKKQGIVIDEQYFWD